MPAKTVLCLNKSRGKNALGASVLLLSQKGNTSKQTMPTTSMAMILPLAQPSLCLVAMVRGINIKDIAAASRRRPKKSSSYQRLSSTLNSPWPLKGDGGRMPILPAFLWFKYRARARGRKAAGKMIAHMP